MTPQPEQRVLVTCDDCGVPLTAVVDDGGPPAVVGADGEGCPNCGGGGFSRLAR